MNIGRIRIVRQHNRYLAGAAVEEPLGLGPLAAQRRRIAHNLHIVQVHHLRQLHHPRLHRRKFLFPAVGLAIL